MAKNKRSDKPTYRLYQVKQLAAAPQSHTASGQARRRADKDFGWNVVDIAEAIQNLEPEHFHESYELDFYPGCMGDVYIYPIEGDEYAYIKFYLDDEDHLWIVSCHK